MKAKWYVFGMILMTVICVSFGIFQKRTYTDISRDISYLDDICVAQIPEGIAVSSCSELSEKLPTAATVVRVKALENVEHLAGTSRQLVSVSEIYQGNTLKENQEIYLTSNRWSLSLYAKPYSIERGFVNVLKKGEEYLVFLDTKTDGIGTSVPVYPLYGNSVIAPVFSFKTHENKIYKMEEEHTYVPYREVRDNEFFAATNIALDAMLNLKEEMFLRYVTEQ